MTTVIRTAWGRGEGGLDPPVKSTLVASLATVRKLKRADKIYRPRQKPRPHKLLTSRDVCLPRRLLPLARPLAGRSAPAFVLYNTKKRSTVSALPGHMVPCCLNEEMLVSIQSKSPSPCFIERLIKYVYFSERNKWSKLKANI